MQFFEKNIAHLIESQFPTFYQEDGELFIEFVKKYYEWMQSSNNAIYHSRRLLEYKDIDSTVDSFIIYFKEKYLNAIQFETVSNTKQFVKHSLDLYRSKGTERSIDLFFKLVYGKPAEVYYPGDDVFKPSAGRWTVPKYLEVEKTGNLKNFVNSQIVGLNSGATAFVEKYIRKKIKGKFIELFYISAISGTFLKDERIASTRTGEVGPTILGSVNTLQVITGGSNYNRGDIVTLYSNNGAQAKARVAATSNISGLVSFSLVNGGWGYSSNTQVLVSDKVLTLSNVEIDTSVNTGNGAFYRFETISQPMATVNYTNLVGETLSVGDNLYKYIDATNIISQAKILSISNTTTNTGTLLITTSNGNFSPYYTLQTESTDILVYQNDLEISLVGETLGSYANTFYKLSNINDENDESLLLETADYLLGEVESTANVSLYTDASAYANVIKNSANLTINIIDSSIPFANGNYVYQVNSTSGVIGTARVAAASYNGTNAIIRLIGANGIFKSNTTLYSNTSNAYGTVTNITTTVGVINTYGTFVTGNNNVTLGLNSNTYGSITRVSTGSLANVQIGNTFIYDETVNMNTDLLKYYLYTPLNATTYGFPFNPTANASTIFSEYLNFEDVTFGSIFNIITSNPGINYDTAPMVVVYDPLGLSFSKRDIIIEIANNTSTFFTNEIVSINDRDIGVVKAGSNSSVLHLKRISVLDANADLATEFDYDEYVKSENDEFIKLNETIIGKDSGAIAIVTNFTTDYNTEFIGINADITANTVTAPGYVTSLDVYDSGYGYYDEEVVTFMSNTNTSEGTVQVSIDNYGFSQGYYMDNDSALSSTKKLHGPYYQEFSYVIRSPVVLNKYEGMLRNILHMAGTKYFAEYVHTETTNLVPSNKITEIEIS